MQIKVILMFAKKMLFVWDLIPFVYNGINNIKIPLIFFIWNENGVEFMLIIVLNMHTANVLVLVTVSYMLA